MAVSNRQKQMWDGKWRIVMFDIPEVARGLRNNLRDFLKQNDFVKLQDSVFVSPYSLKKVSLQYLSQSGLIEYIRFVKAEEIDDDRSLRKKFNLK